MYFCTWHINLCPLQPRTSCTHFLCSSFSQRPHCKLEGAAWYMLAAVLHAHRVYAHLMWNEAHAVRVVTHCYNLSRFGRAWRAGDLSGEVMNVDLWTAWNRRKKKDEVVMKDKKSQPSAGTKVSRAASPWAACMSVHVGSLLETLLDGFCKQDGITFSVRSSQMWFNMHGDSHAANNSKRFLPTSLSCMPSAYNAPSSPLGLGRDVVPILLSLTVRTVMLLTLKHRGENEGFPPSHIEQWERYTPRERSSRARARRNHVTEETNTQAEKEKEDKWGKVKGQPKKKNKERRQQGNVQCGGKKEKRGKIRNTT